MRDLLCDAIIERRTPVVMHKNLEWVRFSDAPPEILDGPGLYMVQGWHDAVLYVGQSKKLRHRIMQHQASPWYRAYCSTKNYDLVWLVTPVSTDKLSQVEVQAIGHYVPKFNGGGSFDDTSLEARVKWRMQRSIERAQARLIEAQRHYEAAVVQYSFVVDEEEEA